MSEKIQKSWGYEFVITNNSKYCGKILHFNKGKKGSLHYHKIKRETWYINSGKFLIEIENNFILAEPGMVFDLPPYTKHQVEAIEEGDIFEVSTQHNDGDTYRI
jgi:mannose-6-phosphate isomerase-like protein (cupin superfamily)